MIGLGEERVLKIVAIFLMVVLLTACSDRAGDGYTIDLEGCTLDGRPMLELLQIDLSTSLPPQAAGRYQRIVTEAADHGVYFGLCGIDVEHGQAMALRIPDLELGRPGFEGAIKPFTSGDTSVADIEARYGLPLPASGASAYGQVRRTGDKMGRFADWDSICTGLTMRLNFDHRDRLSAITIYPTPITEK